MIKKFLYYSLKQVVALVGARRLRKYRWVRVLSGKLFSSLKDNHAMVLGHDMLLDERDSLNLSLNQIHEPFETNLIIDLVQPGDVVLDIGANIGYYTLLLAQKVGKSGKVIAFEPDPTNFEILKTNISANGYDDIVYLNQRAVSDKDGKLRLYHSEDNRADHRVYDSGEGRNFVEIDTVSIDNHLSSSSEQINFVKIDVQGAELQVLRGMTNLIQQNPQMKMITEFWPYGIDKSGGDSQSYLDLLVEHGFTFEEIDENSKQLYATTATDLLKSNTVHNRKEANLLCTSAAL